MDLEHFNDWDASFEVDALSADINGTVSEFSVPFFPNPDLTFLPKKDSIQEHDGSKSELINESLAAINDQFRAKNNNRWAIQSRLYVEESLPDEYIARLRMLEEEVSALNPRFIESDLEFIKEASDILSDGDALLQRIENGG